MPVCGTRRKLRLTKQACFLPTTALTALALDFATGGGQARDHWTIAFNFSNLRRTNGKRGRYHPVSSSFW